MSGLLLDYVSALSLVLFVPSLSSLPVHLRCLFAVACDCTTNASQLGKKKGGLGKKKGLGTGAKK
jgi:hypothetical protein